MKTTVVIVAAGMGSRMKAAKTKQLIEIGGHPILWHTLSAFEAMAVIDDVVLVVKQDEMAYIKEEILDNGGFKKVGRVVSGGKERSDSVWKGIEAADMSELIMIHDGARPFIKEENVCELIEELGEYDGAVLAVPVKDTIKEVDNHSGEVTDTLNRNKLWAIQTPQLFRTATIRQAFQSREQIQMPIYDDAMLVEATTGGRIRIVSGDDSNIKITTPFDLIVAEAIYRYSRGENNV